MYKTDLHQMATENQTPTKTKIVITKIVTTVGKTNQVTTSPTKQNKGINLRKTAIIIDPITKVEIKIEASVEM